MSVTSARAVRALVLPTVLLLAVAVGACGGDDAKVQKLRDAGAQLQQQGQALQRDAAKTAAEVRADRVSADQATKDLTTRSKQLGDAAKATTSHAIGAVKDNAAIPADAKKAFEDAQAQLQSP